MAAVDEDIYEFLLNKQVLVENTEGMEVQGTLIGFKNNKVFIKKDDGNIVTIPHKKVAKIRELGAGSTDVISPASPTSSEGTVPTSEAAPHADGSPSPDEGSAQLEPSAASPQEGNTSQAELGPYESPDPVQDWAKASEYNIKRLKLHLENPQLDPTLSEEFTGLRNSFDSANTLASMGSIMMMSGFGIAVIGFVVGLVAWTNSIDDPVKTFRMSVFGWVMIGISIPLMGTGIPLFIIGKHRLIKSNKKMGEIESTRLQVTPIVDAATRTLGLGLAKRF